MVRAVGQVVGLGQKLLALLVAQLASETGVRLTHWCQTHCHDDPTQVLPQVMATAYADAWRCLELALAITGLSGELRDQCANPKIHSLLLQPLDGLFDTWSAHDRQMALQELQQARSMGLLSLQPDTAALAHVPRLDRTEDLIAQAWDIIDHQDDSFGVYPRLQALLRYHTESGPLLFLALSYFLRQEILQHEELREDLSLKQLRMLHQTQQAGFDALRQLFIEQGELLTQAFTTLAIRFDAPICHQMETLQQEVTAQLQHLHVAPGRVEVQLTHSITDRHECTRVSRLLDRYQTLAHAQHCQYPELLNSLGKLSVATNDLPKAEQLFAQAKTAEAHYNRHRVLLEQRRWADALAALLQAVRLDPGQFEPFPLTQYPIEAILGAGGFGVAYLCRETSGRKLVIKTLNTSVINRKIAEIFSEIATLDALQDERIIRTERVGYADTQQQRAYWVMEYFPSRPLSTHLAAQGALTPNLVQTLAIELAQVLQATQSAGILHGDIKPDNILINVEDNGWRLKIVDWGLAAKSQLIWTTLAARQVQATLLGASLEATYQCAAPERLGLNSARIGTYSDIYAYGKTLCQALFLTPNPAPHQWRSLGTHPLHDLLESCIEDDPKQRPQHFAAVLSALGIAATTQLPAPRPVPVPPRGGSDIELAVELKFWEVAERTHAIEDYQDYLARYPEGRFIRLAKRHLAEWETKQQEALEQERREHQEAKQRASEVRRRALLPQDIRGWDANKLQSLQRRVAVAMGLPVEIPAVWAQGIPALVLVPPGRFLMGSTSEPIHALREAPEHLVTIHAPFYLGKHALTQREWEVIMGQNPSRFKSPSRPVESVSWNDVQEFLQKLIVKTGKHFRLPSEAEWEYASRAGSATPFWWDNGDPPAQTNYADHFTNSGNRQGIHKQSIAPNPWGLYQMYGNIWEWVADCWHGSYRGAPTDGSVWEGGRDCGSRVLRGGAWHYVPQSLAHRDSDKPDSRDIYCGFRVAVAAEDFVTTARR